MKKYQLKAIEELEKAVAILEIERIQHNDKKKENAEEIIKTCLSVLKNQFHDNNLVDPLVCVATIVDKMKLTNFEKMNLFFDFIKPNIKCADQKVTIFSSDIEEEFRTHGIIWSNIAFLWKLAHDKEEEIEIFSKYYPNDAQFILKTIEKYTQNSERTKQSYQILKEDRKPTIAGLSKIKKALENLELESHLIEFLMQELTKIAKPKSDKKTEDYKIKEIPKRESKPIRSMQEWKELEKCVDVYYDMISDLPRKHLDIGEKIELVSLLKELSYKKEKIIDILWRSDELYPMTDLTNTPEDKMRNAAIIKLMIEKGRRNESETSEFQTLLEEAQASFQTESEDKDFWRDMLFQLIDEENQSQLQKIGKINADVSKISSHQKEYWRNIFQEEIEINQHRAIVILDILLQNLKNCPKEERTLWKAKIKETLFRLQLEGIGDYSYEIEKSKSTQTLKRNIKK